MTDNRRWNTQQALNGGVLSIAAPESKCPKDAKLADVGDGWSEESLREGLMSGGLDASMYYGCWSIWKTKTGFSGELMQYRAVTDEFTDLTLDDALEKAEEWASACYG